MIRDVLIWLISLFGTIALFSHGIRLAGKDMEWVGRHILMLVLCVFLTTCLVIYAGTKPPTPPEPPTPPTPESTTHTIKAGIKPNGVIVPYGAPLKGIRP